MRRSFPVGRCKRVRFYYVCLYAFSRVRSRGVDFGFLNDSFSSVVQREEFFGCLLLKKKARHLFLSLFLLCSSLLRLHYISVLTILFRKRFLFLSHSWVTKSDSRSENIHPVRIEAQSRVAENYPVRRGRGRYRAPRRRRRVGVVARRG